MTSRWSLISRFFIVAAFVAGTALTVLGGDQPAKEEKHGEAAPAAQASGSPAAQASPVPVDTRGEAKPEAIAFTQSSCITDPAVIEEFKKRREEFEVRAKELAAREAELKSRERALETEVKKLELVRDDIDRARAAFKKENEEKVSKLVETFQGMSPKAVAQMLTNLDDGLAIAAMTRMDTPKLSKVMNVMDPGRSSRLSEMMAGVVRARPEPASIDAAVTTVSSTKGGEVNVGQNEQRVGSAPAIPIPGRR